MKRLLLSAIISSSLALAATASAQSSFVTVDGDPTQATVSFGGGAGGGTTGTQFIFPQFNDSLASINFAQLVGVTITYTASYTLEGDATNNTTQDGTVEMTWSTTTTFQFFDKAFEATANVTGGSGIEPIAVSEQIEFGPFAFNPEGMSSTSDPSLLTNFIGNGTTSGYFTSSSGLGFDTVSGGTGTFSTNQSASNITITPTITYEYVPEPGIALLSLLGGLGLVLMRRRRIA